MNKKNVWLSWSSGKDSAYALEALSKDDRYKVTKLFTTINEASNRVAMLDVGIKAVTTCIDESKLPAKFCGQRYDLTFLSSLPPDIDPCGEHGEFHTFVYDCSLFSEPIDIQCGHVVSRDGFSYQDLFERS